MATRRAPRIRWECPSGEHAALLAPRRLATDDLCRFCLDCSKASGRLQRRVAPTLEREHQQRAARQQAQRERARRSAERQAARQRERELARHTIGGLDLREVLTRAWALPSLGGGAARLPQLVLRRRDGTRVSGHASPLEHRISVTAPRDDQFAADAVEVLLHELCHLATWPQVRTSRRRQWHGAAFKRCLIDTVEAFTGEALDRQGTAWQAYADLDPAARRAVRSWIERGAPWPVAGRRVRR